MNLQIASLIKKGSASPVVKNIFWMVLDRIWRMAISLVVGVWVVRYLGPDNYGQINYVLAFVSIAVVIANLGMESFLIKELVSNPQDKNKIIHHSFQLRLAVAFIAFFLLLLVLVITSEPKSVLLLFFILVPQLFTTSFTVVDIYFQSELKSRITIVSRNLFFVVGAALKVAAIFTHQGLYVFAALTILDLVFADVFLFFYFRKKHHKTIQYPFDVVYMKSLLRKTIPFLLSNLAIVLYMKIDQILLGKFASLKEVGFFSAATKVAEVFYFMPMVITGSLYGLLIKYRRESVAKYHSISRKIFFLLITLSILISSAITLTASPVIGLLFGNKFYESTLVLQVYIWATVFIFAGVAFNQILVIEEFNNTILYKTVIGVILNIILNLLLIPGFGAIGAALATLITQFVSSIVANFFFKGSRTVFLSYFIAR
jgi:polysaccharide transporter, PST family